MPIADCRSSQPKEEVRIEICLCIPDTSPILRIAELKAKGDRIPLGEAIVRMLEEAEKYQYELTPAQEMTGAFSSDEDSALMDEVMELVRESKSTSYRRRSISGPVPGSSETGSQQPEQMSEADLKRRTKKLALDIAQLVVSLPRGPVPDVYGKQLIRSGSSVGANYRAACRARSDAEMLAKLGIVEEEADESQYWIELLVEGGFCRKEPAKPIHRELDQVLAIVVASKKTLKLRIERGGNTPR